MIRRLFLFDAWPVPCSACIALESLARNSAICCVLIFRSIVIRDDSERFFMKCKYEYFRVNSKYDSCESPTFGIRMAEMAAKRRQIIFSNFMLLLTMLLVDKLWFYKTFKVLIYSWKVFRAPPVVLILETSWGLGLKSVREFMNIWRKYLYRYQSACSPQTIILNSMHWLNLHPWRLDIVLCFRKKCFETTLGSMRCQLCIAKGSPKKRFINIKR